MKTKPIIKFSAKKKNGAAEKKELKRSANLAANLNLEFSAPAIYLAFFRTPWRLLR